MAPVGSSFGLRGPMPPMCTHMEAEPGPPLKQNVTGRLEVSLTPSSVYVVPDQFTPFTWD